MVDSRTDTEPESPVNEEVKVETIEINDSNVQDLHARSEIGPVVTPNISRTPTTCKRIVFDDDEK